MPASVYSVIESLGARAVVAERDFSWEVRVQVAGGRRRCALELPRASLVAGQFAAVGAGGVHPVSQCLCRAGGNRIARCGIRPERANSLACLARCQARRAVPGCSRARRVDTRHRAQRACGARVCTARARAPRCRAGGRTFAVVGILADKDAREIAAALAPLVDHWVLCTLPGPRGSSAADLADRLRLRPEQVTLANSVEEGCEAARAATVAGDRVIVFGSVYTVGPALAWLGVY